MLAISGLIILAVVAAVVVFVATRPSAFRIARTTTIAAPAETVFALIGELRAWPAWNPFERSDPTTAQTYEGASSGVGSAVHYVGKKAGEGRLTILEVVRPQRVVVRAEFIKPFAATNRIELTIAPAGRGVTLTWAMSGTNGFVAKAFAATGMMEKIVGSEFATGLASIKSLAESPSGTPAPAAGGAAVRA